MSEKRAASADPSGEPATGERIAFLCLGAMGHPMAGHLARQGHDVTVYNRSVARAEDWLAKHPGRSAPSPTEAASGADFVLCCSGDDDDLRAVAEPALSAMAAGSVFVDHTTASAASARALADQARERGIGFVDAPVSGGEEGARRGELTIMAGGSVADFERVRPILEIYARRVVRLGDCGSGQLTKMVNQVCIAGILQGLAEGLAFAERSGLDPAQVVEVISQGAAQSWQMDHRAETMIEGRFDFGFAVDWMRKDLAIALAEGRRNGARLPVAALVDQLYAEVQARGGGRHDTSSLIRLLRDTG